MLQNPSHGVVSWLHTSKRSLDHEALKLKMGRLGISWLQGKSIAAMTASDNKILEHEPYPDPFILYGNILKDHTHGVKKVLEILKKKSKKSLFWVYLKHMCWLSRVYIFQLQFRFRKSHKIEAEKGMFYSHVNAPFVVLFWLLAYGTLSRKIQWDKSYSSFILFLTNQARSFPTEKKPT